MNLILESQSFFLKHARKENVSYKDGTSVFTFDSSDTNQLSCMFQQYCLDPSKMSMHLYSIIQILFIFGGSELQTDVMTFLMDLNII